MCTIKQIQVKSGKIGYKICKFAYVPFSDGKPQIKSLYKCYLWTKGENKAHFSFSELENQMGFHCFKYKKDALKFVKDARKALQADGPTFTWQDLVIIKVQLLSSNIKNIQGKVRSGQNSIQNPIEDSSPVYVAPIAVWDGTYQKI